MADKLKLCCKCGRPVVPEFGFARMIIGGVVRYVCHNCSSMKKHKDAAEKEDLRMKFMNMIPSSDYDAVMHSPFLYKVMKVFADMYAEDPSLITDLSEEQS